MQSSLIYRLKVTYPIILMITTVAFVIRWASGQFPMGFNIILLGLSFPLLIFAWEVLSWVNERLNKSYPFERSIPRRIALQVVIGVAFGLFARLLMAEFGEPYMPMKLDSMFLMSTWLLAVMASAGINAIFFTRYFIDRWKDGLIKAERLEREKSQVQFDNLKNQLNPHFLFNALTSLNSLIAEKPALASQFLQHLSKVYRYVLQHQERNFVELSTELEFIRNYVFLAQTRFGDALKFTFDIPATVREKAIVPVTLQILIENALKHNIIDTIKPLSIDVNATGEYLVVSNNLQRKKIVEDSNGQGLENLKSLYRFLTDHPVLVEQDDQRFSVKVPLL